MLTAVVAWIGVVLAASSLGWQVWVFAHTGPRVVVRSNSGVLQGGPDAMVWFVAITVANIGRQATSVQAIGMQAPNGTVLIAAESYRKPVSLPFRLEPHSEFDYWMNPGDLVEMCAEKGWDPFALKPYAKTTSGFVTGKLNERAREVIASTRCRAR